MAYDCPAAVDGCYCGNTTYYAKPIHGVAGGIRVIDDPGQRLTENMMELQRWKGTLRLGYLASGVLVLLIACSTFYCSYTTKVRLEECGKIIASIPDPKDKLLVLANSTGTGNLCNQPNR